MSACCVRCGLEDVSVNVQTRLHVTEFTCIELLRQRQRVTDLRVQILTTLVMSLYKVPDPNPLIDAQIERDVIPDVDRMLADAYNLHPENVPMHTVARVLAMRDATLPPLHRRRLRQLHLSQHEDGTDAVYSTPMLDDTRQTIVAALEAGRSALEQMPI